MSDIEVSVVITGADAEGVVGARVDAGGVDLEDVGGDGALGCDAHVAVNDEVGPVPAGRLAHRTRAAVIRQLYIGLSAGVGIHTLVTSMDIDTVLLLCTLMCTRLTLIHILAETRAQELVALWTHTGELPRLIHTLILTQKTGVAALVNVIAGIAICPQLVALVTAAQEGPVCVVAAVLAGGAHPTLIHIDAGAVIASQLEARLALA